MSISSSLRAHYHIHLIIVCLTWSIGLGSTSSNPFPTPATVQHQSFNTLQAIEKAQQIVIENLSNANTTAYKNRQVRFLNGHTLSLSKDMGQGRLVHTGRSLDLAIQGQGWFQVTYPNGDTGYTRAGLFHLNANGEIVTEQNYPLEPSISIPTDATHIQVGSDGSVTCLNPDGSSFTVGTITLARFPSPEFLRAKDKGIYQATEGSGEAITSEPGSNGYGTIQSGFLEASNVNPLLEQHTLANLNQHKTQIQKTLEPNAYPVQAAEHPDPPHQPSTQFPFEAIQKAQELQTQIEGRLKDKANELLFALVGPEKYHVSVTARINLEFIHIVEETPTNQTCINEKEEVTQEATPDTANQETPFTDTRKTSSTSAEYIVGKTTETHHILPGEINHLSVAVLIDLRNPNQSSNKMILSVEDVHDLIQAALGLKQEDTLVVKQAALK